MKHSVVLSIALGNHIINAFTVKTKEHFGIGVPNNGFTNVLPGICRAFDHILNLLCSGNRPGIVLSKSLVCLMEKGGGRFMQGQKVKFIDKQFLAAMPITGIPCWVRVILWPVIR